MAVFLCYHNPFEDRFHRLIDQIVGWSTLEQIVSGPRLACVRRWIRRAIAPLIVQRSAPRWGRGRWRAKT